MYREFYQLQDNPFGVTPDPDYLFLSASHQEAHDHLFYGVRERKGFIEVIGAPGTGKTTLCRLFLERVGHQTRTAYLFNTFLSDVELLRAVCEEFGLRPQGGDRKALTDTLNRFLIDVAAEGGNAALVIDEAHNLQADALEQLRMLSNLETATDKLLQVVLVGGPELHARLLRPELKRLNERIAVRHRLEPLKPEECEAYLMHRLRVAGWRGRPQVEAEAVRAIQRWSGGVPRRINLLCDRSLLGAFIRGGQRLEAADVKRARQELEALDQVPEPYRLRLAEAAGPMLGRLRQPGWAAAGLLAVVLGAGGFAWSRGGGAVSRPRPEPVAQTFKIDPAESRLEAKADPAPAPQAAKPAGRASKHVAAPGGGHPKAGMQDK